MKYLVIGDVALSASTKASCTGNCPGNNVCGSKKCALDQNTVCKNHCWGNAGLQPWSIKG